MQVRKVGIPGKKKLMKKLNRALAGKLSAKMMDDVFGVVEGVLGHETVAATVQRAIQKSMVEKATEHPEVVDPAQLLEMMNYGEEVKLYEKYGADESVLLAFAGLAIEQRGG